MRNPIHSLMAGILGLGLISMASLPAHPAAGQTGVGPAGTCDEAQLLFISDQSGSLSVPRDGVPATDPDGNRFKAIEYLIQAASELRLRVYTTSTVRVAVVHFGDSARTQLPWTSLEVSSDADLAALRQSLAPQLAPVGQMGNTNHGAAFQFASSLFNQLRRPARGCPIRGVFMITDGQPYLDREGFTPSQHLAELVTYVKQYMPPSEYSIFVVGLDQNDTFWSRNVGFWQQIAGNPANAQRITSAADMATFINQALFKLMQGEEPTGKRGLTRIGSDATLVCVTDKTIDIPPFQEQVILTYFKDNPSRKLDVDDELGPLTSQRSDVAVISEGRDSTIEILRVRRPKPGRWAVRSEVPVASGNNCRLNMLQFSAQARLVAPGPSSTVTQFKNQPVQVAITDGVGNALPDYGEAKYALRVNARLQRGPAAPVSVTLALSGSAVYAGTFLPGEAGPHQVTARALSRQVTGADFQVLDTAIGSFNVAPARMVVSGSIPSQISQYRTFSLTAGIQSQGQPVVLDVPVLATAVLTDPTGARAPVTQTAISGMPGARWLSFAPERAGPYTFTLRYDVDVNSRMVTIGEETYRFDVTPSTLVRVRLVEPGADGSFVATDPILRPSGMPLQIQLLDEAGREVSPGTMGVPANGLFDLGIFDAKTKAPVDGAPVSLIQTSGGTYRISQNGIGTGNYEIRISTSATPNARFVWEAGVWTFGVVGVVNPWFYALAAALLAIALVAVVIAVSFFRSTRHPLQGDITLLQKRTRLAFDGSSVETYFQVVDKWQLTRRFNRQTLIGRFASRRSPLKRLEVSCASANQAKTGACRVLVQARGAPKPTALTLSKGNQSPIQGSDLIIAKDYVPREAARSGDPAPGSWEVKARQD